MIQRLLLRLEKRFGRWAIPNLPTYIVGLNAVVFVLGLWRPRFLDMLAFDPALVREGELWRLVSFIFIPGTMSPVWIIFSLYLTWLFGTGLEAQWGTFRFNVFYFLGMVGTMAAAWILRTSLTNFYLNTAIYLAFATLFPNFELLVFFVLPVKVKWLGLITAAFLIKEVIEGPMEVRIAVVLAVSNYLLFCSHFLVQDVRRFFSRAGRARRIQTLHPTRVVRTCKVCGKSDEDPQVDMRVCSCAKCGEPTSYCFEHARNH